MNRFLYAIEEAESNPRSNTANIRTLSLAIVPGREIVSVAVAQSPQISQKIAEFESTINDRGDCVQPGLVDHPSET